MRQDTNRAPNGANRDASYDAEDYWDRLTDDDRRLIWLTASGMEVREVAAKVAETPRAVARRYRALLLRLGLDDQLSQVLAEVTRTAQSGIAGRRV